MGESSTQKTLAAYPAKGGVCRGLNEPNSRSLPGYFQIKYTVSSLSLSFISCSSSSTSLVPDSTLIAAPGSHVSLRPSLEIPVCRVLIRRMDGSDRASATSLGKQGKRNSDMRTSNSRTAPGTRMLFLRLLCVSYMPRLGAYLIQPLGIHQYKLGRIWRWRICYTPFTITVSSDPKYTLQTPRFATLGPLAHRPGTRHGLVAT